MQSEPIDIQGFRAGVMLIRVYRITDKSGVALLKCCVELCTITLEGIDILVSLTKGGFGGLLNFFLMLILSVFAAGLWLLGKVRILSAWILGKVRTVLSWLLNIGQRIFGLLGGAGKGGAKIGGRTIRATSGTASGAAANTMARRTARAEMEVGLAEDPLRIQNRVLSILVIAVLAVLIVVVIMATSDREANISSMPDADSLNAGDAQPTAQEAALNIPTPVPVATIPPQVIQAGGSLAYVARERGQTDIWAVPIGSRNPIRITNSPEDERDPVWSHGSLQLAYSSRQEGSNWDIYIYDLLTGITTRKTYNLAFEGRPQWSPDNLWLVYEGYQTGTHLDLFVMRVDGSETTTRLGASSDASDFSPAWSPDGRQIAFASWREGNQDIYIFSFDTQEVYNLTNTPSRHEDYPSWSPDGTLLAFSAVEAGRETIFIQPAAEPNTPAIAFQRGRMPSWSPQDSEITSIVFAVDSGDGNNTFIAIEPYIESDVGSEIIQVPKGATQPVWTGEILPPALINAGGLPLTIEQELYIEQVDPNEGEDPPYNLGTMVNVSGAELALLNDRVNDSFNALRIRVNEATGLDFLGRLSDALWSVDYRPPPGVPVRNWHKAGRAFSFNRNTILGFPPPIEIVREDIDGNTYWRIYIRVADEAQAGQLGEPLRHMTWDFASRDQGDIEAYEQGGRLRDEIPEGYYVDLTQIIEDYDWSRIPADSTWMANFDVRNYWTFQKRDGLTWYEAMRELYTEGQLGGFAPAQPGG
jgi:TolB protein